MDRLYKDNEDKEINENGKERIQQRKKKIVGWKLVLKKVNCWVEAEMMKKVFKWSCEKYSFQLFQSITNFVFDTERNGGIRYLDSCFACFCGYFGGPPFLLLSLLWLWYVFGSWWFRSYGLILVMWLEGCLGWLKFDRVNKNVWKEWL